MSESSGFTILPGGMKILFHPMKMGEAIVHRLNELP